MKKIMFFYPFFYKGGTEIAIKNLIENSNDIFKNFKIYLGYIEENSSFELFDNLKEKIEIVKVTNPIEVDFLICCSPLISAYELANNIDRSYTYLWLHSVSCKAKQVFEDYNYLSKMDKILVVSKYCDTVLSKYPYYDLIKNRVEIVHNVVDYTKVTELSKLPIDNKTVNFNSNLNLVTIARICYEKGFSRMLSLANALKEKNVDFKWYILGSGNKENVVKEIKDSFKDMSENVIFLGFTMNPYNILKEADYLVHLSDTETWGLTITEAKTLGIPCIVTNFEAAYEQIEDGKNGIILSKDDTNSYINYVDTILYSKDMLKNNLKNWKYSNLEDNKIWNKILNVKTKSVLNKSNNMNYR